MNLKWPFFCFALIISSTHLQAQCLKGDCHNGLGVYKYPSGAIYEGKFYNGKIADSGTLYFSNGNVYQGDWKNQYRDGKGELKFANGDNYKGDFEKGRFQGKGVMNFNNGDSYSGDWTKDQMHGNGTYSYSNGDRFEGDFSIGFIHGYGTMYYFSGSQYEGNWKENRKHGEGKFLKSDGEVIVGFWDAGKLNSRKTNSKPLENTETFTGAVSQNENSSSDRDCNSEICYRGNGQFIYNDGSKWVGEFRAGKPEGKGICYYANGDRYEGHWKQHSPHGEGTVFFQNGKVYSAVWNYGKPTKELKEKPLKFTENEIIYEKSSEVKIWAVLIGVAGYTHMPTLKYTDDDAYQIYAFLKSPEGGALPDEQIKILIDDYATKENIVDAMRSTFLRADENDVVILYFSGHGLPGSFLPFDYDGYHNQLLHTDIQNILQGSKAKHKICFADACHSGSMLASKAPSDAIIKNYYDAFQKSTGGTALLLSSKSHEVSLEDMGLRQGIYSHFLIKGLKGLADKDDNGIVTITELFNYVHKSVTIYTNFVQNPTLTGNFDPSMPVAAIR